MALRPNRNIIETEICHTLDDVASRGVVLCYSTAGSGAVLGDTSGKVQLAADPSGLVVAGVLMNDFVSLDTTLYHLNFHKDQMKTGQKATVLRKGWVVTDKVSGSPTLGNKAYLTTSGSVTPTVSATGGTAATPRVGEFGGAKDEAGFVKLIVNLPITA